MNIGTAQVLIRPSKSGKKRYVPLNGEGAAFFSEMTAGRTGDSVVFLQNDGEPWGKSHQARLMIEACGCEDLTRHWFSRAATHLRFLAGAKRRGPVDHQQTARAR